MKRLWNSVLLIIVAVVLAAALFPFSAFYTVVHAALTLQIRAFLAYLSNFLYSIALGIDKIGNVVCGALFNATLIRSKSAYQFGNINDTVSYVLARNLPVTVIVFKFKRKPTKVLTWLGWWLVCILEVIDPDHMAKTMRRKY